MEEKKEKKKNEIMRRRVRLEILEYSLEYLNFCVKKMLFGRSEKLPFDEH